MDKDQERILIIRLGALGDLVFCFQSFHEIRRARPNAQITLLTRAPFVTFARAMPWFDHVMVETHPRFADIKEWRSLIRQIKKFDPTDIFDLQGKRRQTILYTLLGGPFGPAWSGAAPLCKYPRPWPPTDDMSFVAFLAAQLRAADISPAPAPDLSWLGASIESFDLKAPYVVLVPGCSPTAPEKRWPSSHFARLAQALHRKGRQVVLIGTRSDQAAIEEIKALAPTVRDLSCQTNIFELAGVLRHALGVIGNDTGPLHLAAALGAPCLALFSKNQKSVGQSRPDKKSLLSHLLN